MKAYHFLVLCALLACAVLVPAGADDDATRTRVVILGVEHSGQLFAEDYRPAVIRAWLDAVKPDAIAVERHPSAFARNDFYGFTYEIQNIALPWAQHNHTPVYPFDWEPVREDAVLAFGFDLQQTPTLRRESGWGGFVSFPEDRINGMGLYMGEDADYRAMLDDWAHSRKDHTQAEAARRLFLYRTFMQARHIEHAAARHPGGTLVVIVGLMHQPDLEWNLARSPGIELVKASSFGQPAEKAIAESETLTDLAAIAWTGLFSVQSRQVAPNESWLQRVVGRLESRTSEHEWQLLDLRLREMQGLVDSGELLSDWLALATEIPPDAQPSWTGIVDKGRLDSDFDPFAALSLSQRALHEASRVAFNLGDKEQAGALRNQLAATLPGTKRIQYLGYWDKFVSQ